VVPHDQRQTIIRHVRAKNWRALKNVFNGYLAEPYEFPPGDYRRRCGTGWTKRRALRSLERRLPSVEGRPLPLSCRHNWEGEDG
jgi:hypothetical protein